MNHSGQRSETPIHKHLLYLAFALLLIALLGACKTKTTPTSLPASPSPSQLPTLAAVPTVVITGEPSTYLERGKAHLEAGETTPAIAHLQAALSLDPDLLEARFYLGNAYTAAGRLPDAEAQYRAVLKVDPEHLSAHSNLGVVYLQLGQVENALGEFQAASALDDGDGQIHYMLGVTFVRLYEREAAGEDRLGKLENARAEFERAIALDPKLPEPYFGLGQIYVIMEEKEKAIEAFEAFLTKGPAQDPAAEAEAKRILAQLKGE